MGDWLGTGRIANQNMQYRDFESARIFVHRLGLKSVKEWAKFSNSGKKPEDIPGAPWGTYKKQWKGYGDWLGTGRIANFNMQFLDFKPARIFVHRLGLKSREEWIKYCKSDKKPQDIPANPLQTYKKQWKGWGDWLGTGRIANQDMQYRDFESARKHVHRLGFKSQNEWREYCKSGRKPQDIPAVPEVYKKQWKGYGDWLGTGRIATFNMQYRDFESARKHVHRLGLKSQEEWAKFCNSGKKPEDIPGTPWGTYKKQWKGMGDWLGTGRIANFNMQFLDFKPARKHVHRLRLKSQNEWRKYCKSGKKPQDIPTNPARTYKKQWRGWGDWLGTGSIAPFNMQFRDFESARMYVHRLGLKSREEWKKYCNSGKKPQDIPADPATTYKKQWKGWGDWLGTGRIAPQDMQFRHFESARMYVHRLGFKSQNEWRKYCKSGKKPQDIPTNPATIYKNEGWKGFGDWLGTGTKSNREISKNYLPFKEAREQVRLLAKKYNLKNWNDYQNAVKKGLIPKNIPSYPNHIYSKNRVKNGKKI